MSAGRVKQSAHNMATGFLYQALMLVLSFVSRTVFIYTLGKEYLGLNGIFTDVLQLLSMADLGFSSAMAYSFYKPLAEHDERRIAALIGFYKKVYNIIAVVVTIGGLACVPFLKYLVKTEQDIPHLELYYLFSLANVIISYLFVYKTTLMTADQKDYKIVEIRMWTMTAKTVLQIAILLLTRNYIAYLAIGVIVQFCNNLIASRRTEKEYPFINDSKSAEEIDSEVKKGIIDNMKSVFVYKVSTTLFSATDNLLISVIIGTAAVGVYSNYLMLSSKLLLVEQIVFSALTASIGNVIAKDKPEKRLQIFQSMQSASFIFCGIITTGFGLMANDVIHVWLGEDYMLSAVTVAAITLNTYFSCVMQPLWIYRDATGLYIKTKYIMLIGAIVNIVLSIVLGHMIGLTGIILASAIARISSYFWYEPKLLFQEYFHSKTGKYYLSMLLNLLLVSFSIVILSLITRRFVVSSWFELGVKVVVIGVVCCGIFMVAYCRTEGFQIIYNKAREILKKRARN